MLVNNMLLHQLFLLISIIINLFIAFFVLIKNFKSKVNISYFLFALFTAFWEISLLLELFIDIKYFYLTSRTAFISAGTIPLLIIFFLYNFLDIKLSFIKKIYLIIPPIIIDTLIVYYGICDNYVITKYGTDYYQNFLYPFFSIYFIIYSIFIFLILIRYYKKTKAIKKLQFKYIILGLIIPYSIGVVTNLLILDINRYFFTLSTDLRVIFSYYGPGFTFILSLFIAYTITKHRLFGIKLLVKKATVHIFFTVFILLIYVFIILYSQNVLIDKYNFDRIIITLLAVIIIAVSFEPLRKYSLKILNYIIFNKQERKYLSPKIIKFNQLKNQAEDKAFNQLDNIIKEAINNYLFFLDKNNIKLLIADADTKAFECTYPKNVKLSISQDNALYQYLKNNNDIVIKEELSYLMEEDRNIKKSEYKKIKKELEKNKSEAAVSIGTGEDILGIILLGLKNDKECYSKEDIEMINKFSKEMNDVLFQAVLYKQAIDRIKM